MTALLPRLFGDVNTWFDTEFPFWTGHFPGQFLRVEDFLNDQEYTIRAEIPGLDPEKDIQLSVANGLLTIHAERRAEGQTATRSEFRYGALQRTVRLPANADEKKITAKYDKGILVVTVPLTAPEPAGRQIPIVDSP